MAIRGSPGKSGTPYFYWVALPIMSGLVGACLVVALTTRISLEALASILVAIGTFVLAYFTWRSVSRTGDVIAGEDRRHQQSLAPLLIIEAQAAQRPVNGGAETGIHVYNTGYGLALKVKVTLEGTLHYWDTRGVDDTEENRRLYAGKFKVDQAILMPQKLIVTEHGSEPFERHLSISAIEADSSHFQHEQVFFDRVYGEPVVHYEVATAEYEDMFGNSYTTKYLDEELDAYEWIQPKHLRIPTPDSR
jgi:hypothetical protein